MTVTGRTIEENLSKIKSPDLKSSDIIFPLSNPIKESGHIQILKGNLAEQGCVAKITGKEGLKFSGPAKVFNSEFECLTAIAESRVKKGDVIVIRYDGRFSGGTHGFVVGHIVPEAFDGGVIAIVENGDIITIDSENNQIFVDLSDDEIKNRIKNWSKPDFKIKKGILYKYVKSVSNASNGCVTDE